MVPLKQPPAVPELGTRRSPRQPTRLATLLLLLFALQLAAEDARADPHLFDVLYLSSTNDRSLSPSR